MFTLFVSAQQELSTGNSYYYEYDLFINEVKKKCFCLFSVFKQLADASILCAVNSMHLYKPP